MFGHRNPHRSLIHLAPCQYRKAKHYPVAVYQVAVCLVVVNQVAVYPLAVHRRNQNLGRALDTIVVLVGDTLLLDGAAADIQRLAQDVDLVDVAGNVYLPLSDLISVTLSRVE